MASSGCQALTVFRFERKRQQTNASFWPSSSTTANCAVYVSQEVWMSQNSSILTVSVYISGLKVQDTISVRIPFLVRCYTIRYFSGVSLKFMEPCHTSISSQIPLLWIRLYSRLLFVLPVNSLRGTLRCCDFTCRHPCACLLRVDCAYSSNGGCAHLNMF